jgi:glucosamine--fructose-6-phosphate aminotransferase (isomerizing)
LVGPGFPVLAFAQPDETGAGTRALVDEFRKRTTAWRVATGDDRGSGAEWDLPLVESPDPACTPLLTVQSFYRAINALALRRGHHPDLPPHLNKVTETV